MFGIPFEFVLFALILVGIALFHHHVLKIALGGLALIIIYKLVQGGYPWAHHFAEEWKGLLNLLGLLLGFAMLAKHFEDSEVPLILPNILPDNWKGGFVLLLIIAVLSSFLDNIAAAMIGGTVASVVYSGRVHIGFIAAIVAASNAGGAGSVVGDTTTTMMWIEGVPAMHFIKAYLAVVPALFIFGIPAAIIQQHYQPIMKDKPQDVKIDFKKLLVVGMILTGAILTNIYWEMPAAGVWIAIGLGVLITKTDFKVTIEAFYSAMFLISLVFAASLMPVESLPAASWQTAFGLGFVSAVFDNIPLTKLALVQGGYDWGILAYAVGFGGSMIWFGSSAGVAVTTKLTEGRSVVRWLRHGWYIILAYIISFFIMLSLSGWHPDQLHIK